MVIWFTIQIDRFGKVKNLSYIRLYQTKTTIMTKKKEQMLDTETYQSMLEKLPSHEWTNEQQLEWQLRRKEESHQQELERMAMEKSKYYVETVILRKSIIKKEEEIEELKKAIHLYHDELEQLKK
jgi:hypothetical protein